MIKFTRRDMFIIIKALLFLAVLLYVSYSSYSIGFKYGVWEGRKQVVKEFGDKLSKIEQQVSEYKVFTND